MSDVTEPSETQVTAQPEDAVDETSTERPTWLSEKFNTPEDMAKGYNELEAKKSKATVDEVGESEDKG